MDLKKTKVREFTKQYFTFNLNDKLSTEIKQELKKLGSWKPYYAENENDRAILLIDLWGSKSEKVKDIVRKEAQKWFKNEGDNFLDEKEGVDSALSQIYSKLLRRREIAKNARENRGKNYDE